MIELLQNVVCSLLRDLHDKTLWLLYVEGRDVHHCFARADLNYVIASTHPLSLLIEDDAVLVKDACLAVDYSARFRKLFSHCPLEMR